MLDQDRKAASDRLRKALGIAQPGLGQHKQTDREREASIHQFHVSKDAQIMEQVTKAREIGEK